MRAYWTLDVEPIFLGVQAGFGKQDYDVLIGHPNREEDVVEEDSLSGDVGGRYGA